MLRIWKPKEYGDRISRSIRFEADLADAMDKEASRRLVSVTQIVNHAVRKYLKEEGWTVARPEPEVRRSTSEAARADRLDGRSKQVEPRFKKGAK